MKMKYQMNKDNLLDYLRIAVELQILVVTQLNQLSIPYIKKTLCYKNNHLKKRKDGGKCKTNKS